MTLEKETRDAIGRTVRSLRELFEAEFGKQASGRFGIRSSPRGKTSDEDGLNSWLDPVESLSLTPAESAQRDELIHALRYLVGEGHEPAEAVARLIREAAFTAVNRLLAVRVAEAIGTLPPVLSSGRQSAGYRETVGDLFPGLSHNQDSYWLYLQVAGDELSPAVPRLFDRRHPTSAFIPSRACVDEALELLTDGELADAWQEPETFGWGYQFFNGEDVKRMREASSAPRNSRELAVRNQFFTPRYVVDWLVQNTLGRRLVQAGYELDLPLLVGEIGDQEPLELEDVRVLDPAVGSGHFLLGSYDLLEQAWESAGIPPHEAAPRILPCLFGIEIDPRAAQVAQAVLLLRARRSSPNADLTPPTIVTAVALPHTKELRDQAFGNLSPAARHLADEITDALDQAPLLGSLLKVEQRLQDELASHQTAPRLAADGTETHVLDELHQALDELVAASASPEQRMFTAEATDALRFIGVCQQRYDAVLMNPPFGAGVSKTKQYIKAAYPDSYADLFSAFNERSIELAKPTGYIGTISSRSGFFLGSFEEHRKRVLIGRLSAVLDLGLGVMHDAMVEAAAYVMSKRSAPALMTTFVRATDAIDKATAVANWQNLSIRSVATARFRVLPNAAMAYWAEDEVLEAFEANEPLERHADPRVGLQTSDDFRFVRLWWEVPSSEVGRDARWVFFVKGGRYQPFFADVHLLVDWEDDGRRLRDFHTQDLGYSESRLIKNTDYYFRPGITWPLRAREFCPQLLPEGVVFSVRGYAMFPKSISEMQLLGWGSSATVDHFFKLALARSDHPEFIVGVAKQLPYRPVNKEVGALAESAWRRAAAAASTDETCILYAGPSLDDQPAVELGQIRREIDELVRSAYGLTAPTVPRRPASAAPDRDTCSLVSFLVGVAFGRYHGKRLSPSERSPRDVLAWATVHPPAIASGPTRDLLRAEGDESLSQTIREQCEGNEYLSAVLGSVASGHDLDEYLTKRFFTEHLGQFSKSGRSAPVYWQLAVPSRRWGLWLYAPSLTRESLFAVARVVREKLSNLNEQISFARERAQTDRDARERAESLEDLAAELEKFAAVADEVAQSGWEPDLNDGVVLNAAPLEELFVDKKWRDQIAKHRKAMQKGDYPWATVQREYFETHA